MLATPSNSVHKKKAKERNKKKKPECVRAAHASNLVAVA